MAKKLYEEEAIRNIAKKIRSCSSGEGYSNASFYKVSTMPEGVQYVHDHAYGLGQREGYNEGYYEGYNEGKVSNEGAEALLACLIANNINQTIPILKNTTAQIINSHVFSYNLNIQELVLPNVSQIHAIGAFESSNYKIIRLNNLRQISTSAGYTFSNCTKLTVLDLGKSAVASIYYLNTCTSLKALILRKTTVASLQGVSYVPRTFANGTGYIYVPSSLIESYKTATNWTTYANQFRALEDYTVDGTVTGEFDDTKI